MSRLLSLPILVATLLLSGCESTNPASSPAASQDVGATVTLAPRLVRNALLPDHLFLGTDDVRIQVVSSNSSFHFDKTVPFSDRQVLVEKVPATAVIVISLEGLDPSGNVLWSGASESLLASTAKATGFTIPLDAQSGVMPYQSANSWLWVAVKNADTTVEWLNFDADGNYSRQLFAWNVPSGTTSPDTFYGIHESGSYLRKGATLEFEPDLRDTCSWRGTDRNECGLSAPNWVRSTPSRYVSSWAYNASAPQPLTLDGYSYVDAGGRLSATPPFVLAPSSWSIDSLGSEFSVQFRSRYLIQFNADGTYDLLATRTTVEKGIVFAAAYQAGKWSGNAGVLNIVPTAESSCVLDTNVTTCDNPANLVAVPTDSIGKPSALTWKVVGDVMTVTDPANGTIQIWNREL